MYLKDFFSKYNGKYIDYDKHYGNQCVDLFRQYCLEVLRIVDPAKGVNGAKDFWSNYSIDKILYNNFEKIPNTLNFIPKLGDVMIWKNGKYGHISICNGVGNMISFQSFDQNWPVGSCCKFVNHNYLNVYGVFRPKNQELISFTSKYSIGTFLVNTNVNLMLRDSPSKYGIIIDKLKPKTIIDGYDNIRGWISVNYNNKWGYISSSYLKRL
jgi:hypothetical protein